MRKWRFSTVSCLRLACFGLLLACFVWRASCLLLAVLLHRCGGLCTSGLLCLACFWLALSGLCCLGLACCARATARKSFIFDRTARGVRTFPDKSSAPRPVFAQLPLQFTANLKRHPCNLQVKWAFLKNLNKTQTFTSKIKVLGWSVLAWLGLALVWFGAGPGPGLALGPAAEA